MMSRPIALSVIVITYNMSREIPRTVFTLSPQFQTGIDEYDYEVIVVDNGSTQPLDEKQLLSISSNVQVLKHEHRSVSPVGAINQGLAAARGVNACVMIDGARMASPGLLAGALGALRLSPHTMVGTVAFHLGDEVQMKSVHSGYNQDVEDELLKTVPWRTNGYSLFDISVFAGSSAAGWFKLPAETNALFMSMRNWNMFGGYDPKFVSPGGGLANLDMWRRACTHRDSEVVLLAGEATFHQFHGGVATNAKVPPNAGFREEYKDIRGEEYQRPNVPFRLYGTFSARHHASLLASLPS